MVNKVDNKFTWVIKDFSSFQYGEIYSDEFLIGGCKSRLIVYRVGNIDWLLFLGVTIYESLPLGWRRHAKLSLKVVNQFSKKTSITLESKPCWFDQNQKEDQKVPFLDFLDSSIPLTKLHSKDGGFLVNDELKIVAKVDVLQVIGKSERSQEATQTIKKIKTNDYGSDLHKTVDVNGFQVSPSQVESVRCIFERHPDFASEVHSNNQHMKSTYMNVLLGLFETLCRFPEELSDDDFDEASAAVSYLTMVGFKVYWLENKLKEVKEKKKRVDTGKAWLQHLEKELEKLNKKCLDLKDLVSTANVPFSFDDVV